MHLDLNAMQASPYQTNQQGLEKDIERDRITKLQSHSKNSQPQNLRNNYGLDIAKHFN